MKYDDLLFWIWLAETLGPDSPDFRYLIDLYQTPYDVFCAESAELERIEGLSPRAAQALSDKNLQKAEEILEACQRLGIGVMTYPSPLYPKLLREIKRPPVLLYYAGAVPDWEHRLCIGMVGTRKMSAYGMEAAYKISYELARANAVVVSGMAAGIDGVCAAAALRANGSTVAVLGCGLDRAYPRHHGLLMKEIGAHGLLLSEYPPGTRPLYYHFPVRNRIISGISHGVVVVEAGVGSGSLITAGEAIAQGRDVFAVPSGSGANDAGGANGLLRDGAIFTTNADDICRRYAYLFAETLRREPNEAPPEVDRAYLKRIGVLELSGEKSGNCRNAAPDAPDAGSAKACRDASAARAKGTTSAARRRAKTAACGADSGASDAPEAVACRPTPILPHALASTNRETVTDAAMSGRSGGGAAEHSASCRAVSPMGSTNAAQPSGSTAAGRPLPALSPVQSAVLQAMADGCPVTVDRLTGLGFSAGELQTALLMLELDGLVVKLPGANYQIASR